MNSSIKQLLSVQEVDSQLIFLKESLRMRPAELGEEKQKVAVAKAAFDRLTAEMQGVKMEGDQRELEVKNCDAEIEKYTVALNQAKSNQEYTILKEQIKRQEELRGQAEEDVLERLTKLDQLEGERKELSDSLSSAEAALRKKEAEVGEIVAGIEKEIESLSAARAALLEGVDVENLKIYERVLARHNNFAIARVDSQVCQGCYMSVTSQEINLLMQGQFVQCKSCSRIFYLDD